MIKHKLFLPSLAVILLIGLVIVPSVFAQRPTQEDDQNEVPLPVQPAKIVPGDDLEMTVM